MKNYLKKNCIVAIMFLFFCFSGVNVASAVSPCAVPFGCTGVATITGIPYGTGTSPLGIVTIGTGLSFSAGTLSATNAGAVTSVSGTTNRITSTGGQTPVIDISASYIGQSSITTLGTIGSGTWAGTSVAVIHGGTGCSSASLTCFNNITGFTASGTTGTTSTNLVFSTSPTFITPNIGSATASGLTLSGVTGATQCLHVNSSGVITGTGSDCGTGNASLLIGTSVINGGTNGRILYDNSGILGELSTIGSGNIVLATSPTLVTPSLGTPTALIGTNITGTASGLTSGITNALASATTTVNVSSATAPTTSQVLTATGASSATWQTPTVGVTSISSANGDISVASATTTPVLTLNSGTSANQIVKLNSSAQLPAVSGALLTNLPTTVKSSSGVSSGPATSSTQTITHGLGYTPAIIRIKGMSPNPGGASDGLQSISEGTFNSTGNRALYTPSALNSIGSPGVSSVFAIYLDTGDPAKTATGVIGNITSTTFDIVWTLSSTTVANGAFIWEAQ